MVTLFYNYDYSLKTIAILAKRKVQVKRCAGVQFNSFSSGTLLSFSEEGQRGKAKQLLRHLFYAEMCILQHHFWLNKAIMGNYMQPCKYCSSAVVRSASLLSPVPQRWSLEDRQPGPWQANWIPLPAWRSRAARQGRAADRQTGVPGWVSQCGPHPPAFQRPAGTCHPPLRLLPPFCIYLQIITDVKHRCEAISDYHTLKKQGVCGLGGGFFSQVLFLFLSFQESQP